MYEEWETKLNFNLTPYLERELRGGEDNFEFYEGLGRAFLAFEKEPDAIWSFQKALTYKPWDSTLKNQLYQIQSKEGLPQNSPWMIPEPLLYQGFAVFFILLLFFWKSKTAQIFFGSFSLILLLLIAFSVWVIPASGIILKSTFLHQLPSTLSPIVIEEPLPSGLKVDIVSFESDGKWLKIKDSDGNIGFIFYETLRVI